MERYLRRWAGTVGYYEAVTNVRVIVNSQTGKVTFIHNSNESETDISEK
jgi:hypothetical protein